MCNKQRIVVGCYSQIALRINQIRACNILTAAVQLYSLERALQLLAAVKNICIFEISANGRTEPSRLKREDTKRAKL